MKKEKILETIKTKQETGEERCMKKTQKKEKLTDEELKE